MKKKLIILFLFAGAVFSTLSAQIYDQDGQYVDTVFHDHVNRQAEDFVTVSLCVADPTDWRDDAVGVLGHAFIRLQCPTFNLDYCFSYESEPLEENLWRAICGDLKMGMFAYNTEDQLNFYRNWNRTVREYQLNLPPEVEQRLWEIMDQHVTKGANLKWDLYRRGCALSLVHFVNEALANIKIEYHEWPQEVYESRVSIVLDELKPYPWIQLIAKIVIDPKMENNCPNEEKLIIPRLLVDAWSKATINGKPLLEYKGDLVKGETVVVQRTYFTPLVALITLMIILIGIGLLIYGRNKEVQ